MTKTNKLTPLVIRFTVLAILISGNIHSAPRRNNFEKTISDIQFRSYGNIDGKETINLINLVNQTPNITMSKSLWEDLILGARTKFEKNSDWHLLVKTIFKKIDESDLNSRRELLQALKKLEEQNRDAETELRDYLRTAKLIDIVK